MSGPSASLPVQPILPMGTRTHSFYLQTRQDNMPFLFKTKYYDDRFLLAIKRISFHCRLLSIIIFSLQEYLKRNDLIISHSTSYDSFVKLMIKRCAFPFAYIVVQTHIHTTFRGCYNMGTFSRDTRHTCQEHFMTKTKNKTIIMMR